MIVKRKKRGEWRKDLNHNWGLEKADGEKEREQQDGVVRWLYCEEEKQENQVGERKEKMTQGKLEPWTWLRLESWKVIVEIARKIEEKALEKKRINVEKRDQEKLESKRQAIKIKIKKEGHTEGRNNRERERKENKTSNPSRVPPDGLAGSGSWRKWERRKYGVGGE